MESRRRFLGWLWAGTLGLFLLPTSRAWAKKMAISLDKAPKLKDVGGWVILKIRERDVMFVRDAAESIRAFDPVCTHQKCLVGYNPQAMRIECGCHKSHYNLDGEVLNGPAPAPLKRFPASLSNNRVIVDLD
jgi:Rieske Fe-S protein